MPDIDTMTLADFIDRERLGMDATRATSNPNAGSWGTDTGRRHWSCVIYRRGDIPTGMFYFTQGSTHTAAPTLEDVLDSLASDARSVEAYAGQDDPDPWIDWADELGLFGDSDTPGTAERVREARDTWTAIEANNAQLRAALGAAAYTDLIERVEPM